MTVGLIYDPIYLKHDTGQHVENAGRLEDVISLLKQSGLMEQLTLVQPRPASTEEISLVHTSSHITRIQEAANRGGGWLDADTVMSPDSYQVALYAAGGAINATEAVIRLQDMGLETFLLGAAVKAALAQRLARVLCKECREPYTPSPEILDSFSGYDVQVPKGTQFYRPVGCKACDNVGYNMIYNEPSTDKG